MEDIEEGQNNIDIDALFAKYDSNKDGKLDADEVSSLLLEVFEGIRSEPTPKSSSMSETVKAVPGQDEMQKLERLYKEGYLSEERYERLERQLTQASPATSPTTTSAAILSVEFVFSSGALSTDMLMA